MTPAPRITIPAADGGRLAAEHHPAANTELAGPGGRPCVVMAHGVGATRDCGLSQFAAALAAAGLDAIAFDYRHFAESSGLPKQLVDLPGQLSDYHSAIAFARALPDIDTSRIVVWGVSLSGGHALKVAATDPDIAAVISLTAAVDGLAAVVQMVKAHGVLHVGKLMKIGITDAVAGVKHRPPVLAPVVGRPGEAAALCAPGAIEGMLATAGPTWRNAIAARIFLSIGTYRPITAAKRVTCPTLMQIADGDQSAPAAAATKAAHRVRATVHHYSGDHFDVYPGARLREQVVRDQIAFLRRVLAPSREAADA